MADARQRGVRVRTTVAATVVVGLALLVAAVGLSALLHRSLVDNVADSARVRADDVVGLLEQGTPPDQLRLEDDDDEETLVQVQDGDGVVLAATPPDALDPIEPVAEGSTHRADDLAASPGDPYLVVTEVADDVPGGSLTVVVARSLDDVEDTLATVRAGLLVGVPLLALVAAVTTWVVAGIALRPVDDMVRRLEASRDRQRRFTSDASHELRSPIATIRHELEVALADPEQVDVTELGNDLLAEDLRLERLVDDLLLLARTDEASPLHRTPVDLDDLVLDEVRRLRSRGRVQVDATGVSAGRTSGDRSQLARVVRNLAENAERHARSAVAFGLAASDGLLVLTVDDDGPGVAPEDRARAFERFTRLDAARARDTGGSGLGLAIVAEVAAAHGGSVRVAEAPSGGARFEVRLPADPLA